MAGETKSGFKTGCGLGCGAVLGIMAAIIIITIITALFFIGKQSLPGNQETVPESGILK